MVDGLTLELADRELIDYLGWRREALLELGVRASYVARLVDRRDVAVADVRELVKRGCPPDVAARILSPIELEPRPRVADLPAPLDPALRELELVATPY